ncbi:MAG TPA: cytochrome c3 family protein [Nitrospirota bacterium]|nr:cytochrome c3 family protein [Nitrospirota bacterium]
MKRSILVVLTIGVFLTLGTVAMAGLSPGSGIKGTAHDMSSSGLGAAYGNDVGGLDRICIYCHTPHHANSNITDYSPLWNHNYSMVTSYQTYTNTTTGDVPGLVGMQLNAVLGQPGSVSKLCLGCHDGSVAVAAYGNFVSVNPTSHGNSGANLQNTPYQIGAYGAPGALGNLQNHHPIGFNYKWVATLDDEIAMPDNALPNGTGMLISDVLWGGNMECSSCHDVHNTRNTGSKFTWVEDTQSALCLTCHIK